MDLRSLIKRNKFFLVEGSIIERLRRNSQVQLLPNTLHAGLIYHPEMKHIMEKIFKEYIDIAKKYDVPIVIFTPTWRANHERIIADGFQSVEKINQDNVKFILDIKHQYPSFKNKIFCGGLIGCKNDAYQAHEALSTEEARVFHKTQINSLAKENLDILIAETLPSISEALGIAQIMGKTHKPYIISFMISQHGTLLDGTLLSDAISIIDTNTSTQPLCYFVNCIHPIYIKNIYSSSLCNVNIISSRLKGVLGNGSKKEPHALENLDYFDSDDPVSFAKEMIALYKTYRILFLGGCCGTDNRHIDAIAKQYKILNCE